MKIQIQAELSPSEQIQSLIDEVFDLKKQNKALQQAVAKAVDAKTPVIIFYIPMTVAKDASSKFLSTVSESLGDKFVICSIPGGVFDAKVFGLPENDISGIEDVKQALSAALLVYKNNKQE